MNRYPHLFEVISNNATFAIFVLDDNRKCIFMNPAAEKLTGYKLEEIQDQPLHNYLHHSHPDGSPYPIEDCPIDRVFPQNFQEQGEEVLVHKNGSFYPIFFIASPIRENGRLGTIVEIRDISDEKAARAEHERLLDAERAAREESETIRRIGHLISAELDLQKIVQAVTDAATEITRAEFGAFFYNVLDERGESFMLYTLSGVPREKFSNFAMPRATAIFYPTFHNQGTIRSADITKDSRFGKNPPYH